MLWPGYLLAGVLLLLCAAPREAIRRYEAALQKLAADPDPAIAAPARKALDMLD